MSAAWRRPGVVALWAVAAAAAGGLGGRALAGVDRTPVTHTVTIDATRYQPARLAVHVGDTVVWVNKDLIPHTATARGGAFDSAVVAAGASWRFTVKAKGATDYGCTFHPTMTGRIDAD
jgi:plastocyanin